jgi:hypothetical protein
MDGFWKFHLETLAALTFPHVPVDQEKHFGFVTGYLFP